MGRRHQVYRAREGWLYLTVILDLHSRRVIGYTISNQIKRDLAIRALDMAIALRKPPPGRIHHTDRSSQYCSHDYQKRLRQHGFKVSMSGNGKPDGKSRPRSFNISTAFTTRADAIQPSAGNARWLLKKRLRKCCVNRVTDPVLNRGKFISSVSP